MDNNVLIIKYDNNNQNNSLNNNKKKFDSKARKSIFVGEALETNITDLNIIELPKNYTKNKNLKIFLTLLFVFVGIGLAIILPFVIKGMVFNICY
jgi:hypothetical protein